jgi:hypothetical protein
MQQTLGYSLVAFRVALLPLIAMVVVAAFITLGGVIIATISAALGAAVS